MVGVYKKLAKSGFVPRCSDAFALDEYDGIAPSDSNSYANELHREFSKGLGWRGEIHVPGQGKYSGEEGPTIFEEAIAELGPLSVQLLGLGVNGHVAFNEPGSAFNSRTRRVKLHMETIEANSVHFDDVSLVPTHAVSQGLATISRATTLLLLVFGAAKVEALTRAVRDPGLTTPFAAFADHPDLNLITDINL